MLELTVSINEASYATLRNLAETSGETIQTVLDKAIENYRRYVFLVQANRAFALLRQNEALWQAELEERQAWGFTMADGVDE